ncbi:MAG: hydantoinase/oxoprolinase family protein [Gammaproteobacteria bacterium]|nr:hydantoinase/oxoprolinase family protein [Gammaproteobacteria bacterium]
MGLRIGVDVGGTFTDFLVVDEAGNAEIHKTSTTPDDPSIGFFRGLQKAAGRRGWQLDDFLQQVETIVHGTTITTNATLTGDGANTGFITTKGFRDVLNMRRGLKEHQFEKYSPPPALVERSHIRAVEERINVSGDILTPLNEADVRSAAQYFREEGIEAVAVSFLWSFRNPVHELRVKEILEQELPGIYVSLSTEILPQIRLYERNSTTALNAYVGPVLTRYISRLLSQLETRTFTGNLLIMQSNGGVMSPQVAQRFASNTLLSGPAGAPMAGVFYGNTHGFKNVITIDMGGTSFDVALVKDAEPGVTTEGMIGEHRIASPILDIHTIGAGGGSIAWIDRGGLLAVGPKSAGAAPGPACYGRGGTLPTVTDAQYVLGYLDPAYFEEGELQFDAGAARTAIDAHIAQPLSMDPVAAADGIYQLVNNNMAAALGVVSVERGYDPREFVLVVAGGAGPIHAAAIARELDIPLILIPRESSVFCAAGMLISDLKHDYVRTCAMDIDRVDTGQVNALFAEMTENARQTLESEAVSDERVEVKYSADLRYIGQFNEVEVPLPHGGELADRSVRDLCAAFHSKHDSLYGYSMPDADVELINLRITARGKTEKPAQEKHERSGAAPNHALLGSRDAWFDDGFADTPVYDGLKLVNGNRVTGPAIVVQPTTTIIVPPDFALLCDEYNNYLMYPVTRDIDDLINELR